MGLYGSPDTGNLYKENKPIKRKSKGKIQTNIVFLILILVFDISFLFTLGFKFDVVFTVLMIDSIILGIISIISLIYNLVKKNKAKDDIIFLLSSIVAFFILAMILGSIMS